MPHCGELESHLEGLPFPELPLCSKRSPSVTPLKACKEPAGLLLNPSFTPHKFTALPLCQAQIWEVWAEQGTKPMNIPRVNWETDR